MSEPDRGDEENRGAENAVLLIGFVALVAAGVWLLVKMADVRQVQNCAGQGRRDCGTIELQQRSH